MEPVALPAARVRGAVPDGRGGQRRPGAATVERRLRHDHEAASGGARHAGPAETREVQWFLAALIEDEGDRCGLVDDDPYRAHVEYVGQLLTQLGVTFTMSSGSGGFWVVW